MNQTLKAGNSFKVPPEHRDVWEKLQSFHFDEPDAPHPFSARLAKEQKWSRDFTARAIEEYRKFLYLLYGAGRKVTPSKVVDEVWHLHLLYTHSYWELLCLEIFQRPIHHHPGNGTDEDNEMFAAIYERTLDDYAAVFGEPPVDIWGKRHPCIDWKTTLARLPMSRSMKSRVLELFAPVHGSAERGPI